MIKFAVEPLTEELQAEFLPLFEEHYENVGHRSPEDNSPIWKLNPAWEVYYYMQEQNVLHVCTIRDDGKLVGYYVNMITNLPHYKHVKAAISDLFFIKKEYRRGRIGKQLFEFMESEVKKLGINTIKVHYKIYYDIGALLKTMDYFPIERVFSKNI